MSITSYNQIDSPDPVQLTDLATKNYVDGLMGRSGTVVHEAARAGVQSWGSTASTAYVVIAGGLPFTKLFAGTTLRVHLGISGYGSAAGCYMQIGVSPTNSSADIVPVLIGFFNNASYHVGFSGMVDITGRAAGAYTFTWWVHSNVATATVAGDANDQLWARVTEVWP